ncbi:sigma-70 family RNA polymerase sigma factor [bacterium]|nr:sigma-70 family RNA polymerase sigma factor [bacterium]
MIPETDLIKDAQNGHSAAFKELVDRHKEKLYYLCLDLTGRHHDAEDLSQETFIKAYKNLSRFREESKFSSWIYRIAVNTHLNQRRKKSVTAMQTTEKMDTLHWGSEHTAAAVNPEEQAHAGQIQEHIDKAMDRLSPKERCVFILRHYDDFPLADIAEIMGISVGTVKSTLFRGIKKLRKALSFYKCDPGMETGYVRL